jgi:hypothetical protein
MLRSDALLLRARTALAAAESRRAPRPLLRETSRAARVLGRMGRPDAEAAAQLLRAALTHRRGDRRGALALLEHAEAAYARASMALHVAYARRRRGELLGGDAGSALVGDADHTLASAGIGRVGPWLALQAPGFGNVPTRAQ